MKTSINGLSRLTRILFGLAIFVGFLTSVQAATYTVSNNADTGGGTLREAIQLANGSAGLDTINFSGVTTIALTTPLPAITDQVFIDGGAIAPSNSTVWEHRAQGLGQSVCTFALAARSCKE